MAYTSLLQWTAPKLYKQSLSGTTVFTTNYVVQEFILNTASPHNLTVGDLVEFQEVSALQTPLVENKVYSVIFINSSTSFSVSLDGVNAIAITNNGSNNNTYKSYSTNIILENFNVTQDAPEDRAFWHESIINNHREIVNVGKMHWLLEFRINLLREPALATKRTDFDELFGYLYTDVYVSRCNINGAASIVIRDSSGDPVSFVMDGLGTSFLSQSKFDEVLTITLKSKDPIDLSETL